MLDQPYAILDGLGTRCQLLITATFDTSTPVRNRTRKHWFWRPVVVPTNRRCKNQSGRRDSNSRSHRPERCVFATRLLPEIHPVGVAGVEPAAPCPPDKCAPTCTSPRNLYSSTLSCRLPALTVHTSPLTGNWLYLQENSIRFPLSFCMIADRR